MSFRVTVLISGNGSNLQAIIDANLATTATFMVASVISDQANAYGLQRAAAAEIPHHCITRAGCTSKAHFEQQLLKTILESQPDLVVLAGFMRILGPTIVTALRGRLINIHPSLLPKFPGLKTHQRAIDADERQHGTTIHLVAENIDAGQIIAQAACPITPGDTATDLQHNVQRLEHKLYPQVITNFARGIFTYQNGKITCEGKPLKIHSCEIQNTLL